MIEKESDISNEKILEDKNYYEEAFKVACQRLEDLDQILYDYDQEGSPTSAEEYEKMILSRIEYDLQEKNHIHQNENTESIYDVIQNDIDKREISYYGIYHDIGVVLDKYSTNELIEFYRKNHEDSLRTYIEDKIISDTINQIKYDQRTEDIESEQDEEDISVGRSR